MTGRYFANLDSVLFTSNYTVFYKYSHAKDLSSPFRSLSLTVHITKLLKLLDLTTYRLDQSKIKFVTKSKMPRHEVRLKTDATNLDTVIF